MFDREIRLSQLMLGYLKNVVKDLDEAQWTLPVIENANPPAWIVTHLAVANDSALRCLGQPPLCPAEWHSAFGIGKSPRDLTISYPSKDELLEKLEEGNRAICAAAKNADSQTMDRPHTIPLFQGSPIQSVGDVVSLLMTTHIATHIGQLSLMRRQLGFAPIF